MRHGSVNRGAIGAAILSIACVASAAAVDVIKARQQNMKQIGTANKAIMDELRKPDGSVAVIQSNAKTLAAVAGGAVQNQWPAGSGPESGVETKALPAIWQNKAKFQAGMKDFAAKANTLAAVSAGGGIDRIRPAAMAVGETCKSCHEEFRARKQ